MFWQQWLVITVVGLACRPSFASDRPLLSPDAAAKALPALELPPSDKPLPSGPLLPAKRELRFQFIGNCHEEMALLARTEVDVDAELLCFAESNRPLYVRYRAVSLLARRGNQAAIRFLEAMCQSKDADERYLAWKIYGGALQERTLAPPKDFARHLALYETESDDEVRESIEWFLGNAQAQTAVPHLVASLERRPGSSTEAIWSLGKIGDHSAVPTIINDYAHSGNNHIHIGALGYLATPEAVDFVIAHLGDYGAVDALYRTKSEKALPALRKHLRKLTQTSGDVDIDLAATRIAILRLSREDCREELLTIGEDRTENEYARWDAIEALRSYDSAPLARRILDIYRSDPDSKIKRVCIWLLEDSEHPGVTTAMIDHVLETEKFKSKNDYATAYSLVETLNKRLGTVFQDPEKMRAYVRTLRN